MCRWVDVSLIAFNVRSDFAKTPQRGESENKYAQMAKTPCGHVPHQCLTQHKSARPALIRPCFVLYLQKAQEEIRRHSVRVHELQQANRATNSRLQVASLESEEKRQVVLAMSSIKKPPLHQTPAQGATFSQQGFVPFLNV